MVFIKINDWVGCDYLRCIRFFFNVFVYFVILDINNIFLVWIVVVSVFFIIVFVVVFSFLWCFIIKCIFRVFFLY